MKTISHLILRLCFSFLFLFFYSCSSEAPVDGILPNGYSWAYGAWHIIPNQEVIEGGNDISDIIIGSNYVQDPRAFGQYDELYPIYTLPKLKYQVYNEDYGDCISIAWSSSLGYEDRLYLDKQKKTISLWPPDSENAGKYNYKKFKVHIDQQILNEYNSLFRSCPLWGEWKPIRRGLMNWTLNPSDSLDAYVITKNHHYLISLQQGDYFTYESNDKMKWHRVLYEEDDPRDSVIVYKRYDAKKENEERLTSIIVSGKYFSRSFRVTDDVEVRQTIYFYKDGSGTSVTRNVNIWTGTLESSVSELRFNWHLNNDIVECSFSSGEKSHFKVKESLFNTLLVAQENQAEFRMGSLN